MTTCKRAPYRNPGAAGSAAYQLFRSLIVSSGESTTVRTNAELAKTTNSSHNVLEKFEVGMQPPME